MPFDTRCAMFTCRKGAVNSRKIWPDATRLRLTPPMVTSTAVSGRPWPICTATLRSSAKTATRSPSIAQVAQARVEQGCVHDPLGTNHTSLLRGGSVRAMPCWAVKARGSAPGPR